jgi:hypothetical protein
MQISLFILDKKNNFQNFLKQITPSSSDKTDGVRSLSLQKKKIMKNWLTILCKTFAEKSNSSQTDKNTLEKSLGQFTQLNNYDCKVIIAVCLFSQRRRLPAITDITNYLSEHLEEFITEKIIERLIYEGWLNAGIDGPFGNNDIICLSQQAEQGLKKSNQKLLPTFQAQPKNKTLRRIIALAGSAKRSSITLEDWTNFCQKLISTSRAKFLQELKSEKFSNADNAFLLFATGLCLTHGQEINLEDCIEFFFSDKLESIKFKTSFNHGHPLVQRNYLALESDYRDNKTIRLSSKWLGCCLGMTISSKTKDHSAWTRIKPQEIITRDLYYNESTQNIYEIWKNLLKPDGFNRFSKLTKERNELSGITVLLSGPPGTGKTELCKQIAKDTGRDLLLFEVSQGRDKFFGESEKIIKGIFTTYRELVRDNDSFPILLFNEGDSIFQKRKEGNSAVAQTENTIQTILLNELEVFEGILMVTTNIPDSFDPAFDRRFLFKETIELPNLLVREQLLQHHFPNLPPQLLAHLAHTYEFSAAELINFKRQVSIQMLTSKSSEQEIVLNGIELFLSNGKRKPTRNPIGFKF